MELHVFELNLYEIFHLETRRQRGVIFKQFLGVSRKNPNMVNIKCPGVNRASNRRHRKRNMLISYAWKIMQISYAWKPGRIFLKKIPASGRPIWRLEWNDARKKITPGILYYAWNSIHSYIMISMQTVHHNSFLVLIQHV